MTGCGSCGKCDASVNVSKTLVVVALGEQDFEILMMHIRLDFETENKFYGCYNSVV